MKKLILYISIFIAFLLVALVAIPFIFKDQIKARLNAEIEKNINAKVFYGDFGLSLFKNFPQITLTLNDFGLHGNAPFAGDTLLAAQQFHASFDLSSIWKKEPIAVQKISVERPKIKLIVLPDGTANYNIYQTKTTKTDTSKTQDFRADLQNWEIIEGKMVFDDRQTPLKVVAQNINHDGSGTWQNKDLDIQSKTSIGKLNIDYKKANYINNRSISFEGAVNAQIEKNKYAVTGGNLKINELPLKIDGSVAMPDSNIVLDLKFAGAQDEDFKKILSLVPSLYANNFDDIKAEGKYTLNGWAKGVYNEVKTPSFEINTTINNGKFQYAGLKLPVSNINIQAKVSNKTDRLARTEIDIKTFKMNIGNNPLQGHLQMNGLENAWVDGSLIGKINLADIKHVYPMNDLTMAGLLDANLQAKGAYSKTFFPKINGALKLANGYLKSKAFPEPIEKINLDATIVNRHGNAADTHIILSDASLWLQNEPFQINGTIDNPQSAIWDLAIKGKLDLEKITKIYPLEGMTLKGKFDGDITTKGSMAAIDAKNYPALNATGTAQLTDFEYKDAAFAQLFTAKTANLSFDKHQIKINAASGKIGNSDYSGSGILQNYFGYMFGNGALTGTFDIVSQKFDMNEWMEDDPNKNAGTLTSDHIKALEVPNNLDITLKAKVGQTAYEKMPINNATGNIIIKDGKIDMQSVLFNALGGRFVTNGNYNATDIARPKFAFDLDLQEIGIPEAYEHLWVVKTLVPIAEYFLGKVTSKLKINGELGQDMVPKIMSLSGQGLVKLIKATVKDNPVAKELAEKAKIPVLKNMVLKDLLMQAEVKEGRIGFRPFSFNVQDYKFTVGGYNALDGSIDWNINVDAPTGKVGEGLKETFKMWTGKTLQNTERVQFDLRMGGSYKVPKLAFVGSKTANNLKETLTAEAKAQIEAAKAKAQAELDALKAEAEAKKKELEDRAKAEVEKLKAEAEAKKKELEAAARAEAERLKKEAEDRAKAEIERIKREAEERAKIEADKLKKMAEEKLAEEKAKLERIAKAKLDSAKRAQADQLRKAVEERAKDALEAKKRAAEAKAKEAEERAKKELEEKKKELEKEVKKDSTE